MPASRIALSFLFSAAVELIKQLSVISMPTRPRLTPLFLKLSTSLSTNPVWPNCTGETLNSSMTSSRSSSFAISKDFSITKSPILLISPLRSAIGMKTLGETMPRVGLCQRMSASAQDMASLSAL